MAACRPLAGRAREEVLHSGTLPGAPVCGSHQLQASQT